MILAQFPVAAFAEPQHITAVAIAYKGTDGKFYARVLSSSSTQSHPLECANGASAIRIAARIAGFSGI